MLDAVDLLDVASGKYHIEMGSFGNEVFCKVAGPTAMRVLASYTKDSWNTLQTEFKGEIEDVPLREGEGWVDGSYSHFLPDSLVGIVRGSVKSPGPAAIAHWISEFTTYDLVLQPLPKADLMAGLNRPSNEVLGVRLKAKRSLLPFLRKERKDVAGMLEAASAVAGSSKADVTLGTASISERPAWWAGMQEVIADLAGADLLQQFDAAQVKFIGRESLNLRNAYVQKRVEVDLQRGQRIGAFHSATAILDAYDRLLKDGTMGPAIEAWKATLESQSGPTNPIVDPS